MKADDIDILENLFDGRSSFEVPVYQRNYDWRREQCELLLNNFIDSYRDKREEYFIGSFVIIALGDKRYNIIDGQQRMTTLTLLLLAIHNYLKDNDIPNMSSIEKYIFSDINRKEKTLILKQIKSDDEYLHKIINDLNIKEDEKNSNIVQNYLYFKKYLNENKNHQEIWDALNRLRGVKIILKEKDNPQVVFETLNATGLELTESDKIRNFILMGEKEQKKLYETHWVEIEKNCQFQQNNQAVSDFIRFYLIYKTKKTPKEKEVYFAFKKFLNKKNNREVLKDLHKYSEHYKQIISEDSKFEYRKEFLFFYRLKITVFYPFILLNFEFLNDKKISPETFSEVCFFIENYVLRRLICKAPNNGLNKVVESLIKEFSDFFDNETTTERNYINNLKELIYKKMGNTYLPNNEELEEAFIERDFYRSQGALLGKYLLVKLETYKNKDGITEKDYSIEHFAPQTLTKDWYKELGSWSESRKDVNEKFIRYKNRIGNLSLTGENSERSNKSRKEKIKYIESNSRMNFLDEDFREGQRWKFEDIDKRSERLFERLKEIYPFEENIKKDYQDGWYSLINGEIDSFKSIGIRGYKIDEDSYEISRWSDCICQLVQFIYEKDKYIFNKKIIKNEDFRSWFPEIPNKNDLKIDDNLYLNVQNNTDMKVSFFEDIVEKMGWEDDIDIEVNLEFPKKND